jgi:hypothetical protein
MSRSRRPGRLLRRACISPRKWTIKSLDLVDEHDGPALAAPHALRRNQEIGFVRVGFETPGAPVHRRRIASPKHTSIARASRGTATPLQTATWQFCREPPLRRRGHLKID